MGKPLKKQPPALDRETIGDAVEVALKIAKRRYQIQVRMREAILADDDAELKTLAKQLVGLTE